MIQPDPPTPSNNAPAVDAATSLVVARHVHVALSNWTLQTVFERQTAQRHRQWQARQAVAGLPSGTKWTDTSFSNECGATACMQRLEAIRKSAFVVGIPGSVTRQHANRFRPLQLPNAASDDKSMAPFAVRNGSAIKPFQNMSITFNLREAHSELCY